MSPRTAPMTGGRAWLGAGLAVLAVLTGVWTLRDLVATGPWLAVSALLVILLAVLTTSLRHLSRSRVTPSAWGLLAALLAIGSLYGGQGTAPTLPMPTLETVRRVTRLAQSGIDAVADGQIPVEPTRGLELLIVAGALATLLAVDLVALGLGRAGLSGVFLVALWSPAAVFERLPATGVLVLGGATYLMLLSLTRPRTGPGAGARDVPRETWTALGAAAGVTALALVLGPVASAAPFFGTARLPGTWGPGAVDGPLRLSTDLDMRSSLATRTDRPLLSYTTEARSLGPLRMYTMTEFDGSGWVRDPRPVDGLRRAEGMLWPSDGTQLDVPDEDLEDVSVSVGPLDQDRLPIPIDPRTVDIAGTWRYDELSDEVVADGGTTQGASYSVQVAPRDLSAEALAEDGPGDRFSAESPFLQVPESVFAEEIRQVARDVTAEETTAYDRAIALQSYFRSASNFRYDTEVPSARTEDAVWDFLTERSGYCVQYATAMTVMARMLDIPARLAVGFLPGRANPSVSGEFVVTGRQSHAWPELYFENAGWVRFEPTPAVQTGAPPTYADPNAGTAPFPEMPTPTGSAQASVPPAQAPGSQDATGAGGRVSIGTTSVPLLGVLGAAVLVVTLAAVATMMWLSRRRRRRRVPTAGPQVAWQRLRAGLAEHGVSWSDATTTRQAAQLVLDAHDDLAAAAALRRLAAAVENELYAPRALTWTPEELDELVAEAMRPFEGSPASEPDRQATTTAP